ncbi:unnamed protein product [Closterium sp. NIES-54]
MPCPPLPCSPPCQVFLMGENEVVDPRTGVDLSVELVRHERFDKIPKRALSILSPLYCPPWQVFLMGENEVVDPRTGGVDLSVESVRHERFENVHKRGADMDWCSEVYGEKDTVEWWVKDGIMQTRLEGGMVGEGRDDAVQTCLEVICEKVYAEDSR